MGAEVARRGGIALRLRVGLNSGRVIAGEIGAGSMHREEQLFYGTWGTGVLVETLLERGGDADVREAEETIDRLANRWPDGGVQGTPVREIMLLRLRTLLAGTRGDDDVVYRDLVQRYNALAGVPRLRRTHRLG